MPRTVFWSLLVLVSAGCMLRSGGTAPAVRGEVLEAVESSVELLAGPEAAKAADMLARVRANRALLSRTSPKESLRDDLLAASCSLCCTLLDAQPSPDVPPEDAKHQSPVPEKWFLVRIGDKPMRVFHLGRWTGGLEGDIEKDDWEDLTKLFYRELLPELASTRQLRFDPDGPFGPAVEEYRAGLAASRQVLDDFKKEFSSYPQLLKSGLMDFDEALESTFESPESMFRFEMLTRDLKNCMATDNWEAFAADYVEWMRNPAFAGLSAERYELAACEKLGIRKATEMGCFRAYDAAMGKILSLIEKTGSAGDLEEIGWLPASRHRALAEIESARPGFLLALLLRGDRTAGLDEFKPELSGSYSTLQPSERRSEAWGRWQSVFGDALAWLGPRPAVVLIQGDMEIIIPPGVEEGNPEKEPDD